jgi:hypothetical protein
MNIESIVMQDARYVRENASSNAQVQRLMRQMDRETSIAKAGPNVVHDPEQFPNHIPHNNTERVRRMLDII